MITQYQSSLETAERDGIIPILDAKLQTKSPNQIADYIGYSLDNLEDKVKRIDEAIKELQAVKAQTKSQIEIVKAGVSQWLTDNGIDKLQGDRISSITVSERKESVEVVILNEEAVINAGCFKMVIDKTEVKNRILNGIEIDGAKLETTHNEPSIRVNRKKAKDEILITV